MTRTIYFGVGLCLGALFSPQATHERPDDPVKISPQYYTIRLENDRVRVLEYRLKPGEGSRCIRICKGSCTTWLTPVGESHCLTALLRNRRLPTAKWRGESSLGTLSRIPAEPTLTRLR
jgi:hypothetical protein